MKRPKLHTVGNRKIERLCQRLYADGYIGFDEACALINVTVQGSRGLPPASQHNIDEGLRSLLV